MKTVAKPQKPKIVDGHLLMKSLKLKPGPIIGELLKIIQEAQALNKIHTSNDAIALARKKLTKLKKKYKISGTSKW